jgi:hypothetical protein
MNLQSRYFIFSQYFAQYNVLFHAVLLFPLVRYSVSKEMNPSDNLVITLSGPASLSSLLGAAEGECSSLSTLGKTEVCLILSPAPGTT